MERAPDKDNGRGEMSSISRRRIVLTGGPGAGKTAVLDMLRLELCEHVAVLPESAGIVFGGGFPRNGLVDVARAGQRAIFHVQRELERAFDARPYTTVLCDRGTIDGLAYWRGGGGFFREVGTTREGELARYDTVVHLRVPADANGYGHQNPLRTENGAEARAIDERILAAWQGHPRRIVIQPASDFLEKARRAIAVIRGELPACCGARVRASGIRRPESSGTPTVAGPRPPHVVGK
jgi:predicted ATPase